MPDPAPFPFDAPPAAPAAGGIAARALAAGGASARYLHGLNPEQRRAAEALDGPVLVLAGAGTGKTRVLTARIAHILAQGRARPADVLAVTFTNKAAREMRHRLAGMLGDVVEGMAWLGTFHSIGTKLLRRHAELAGLQSGFTILDSDDQQRLMKQVIRAADLDDKRWPARGLANLIDGWKNRALTPALVPPGEGAGFGNGKGLALYSAYQARLKDLNATDFGDLLLEPIRLFRENAEVLAGYRRRFRFVLVDEYQDTNTAQYQWLRLLAGGTEDGAPRNICCVGDDDQSIYGWRGAEVDNILRFEHDFPGALVVRLERNYRSTGHVLAAAAHLIARNEDRLGKTLFTDGERGEKVEVAGVWDSEEEARTVTDAIESLRAKGHKLDEMAILCRASFQMREFEERFVTVGMPYRVIGGPRFYERAEIRDALAYLRCVAQPSDDLAFERIVNVPKRGLGDATIQQLHAHARATKRPLMEATRELTQSDELKPKQRGVLTALLDAFDRWRALTEATPHGELAETVLEESGYTDMWKRDRSADAGGRLENLKELVRSMEDFENLTGFLEHVSLVMEASAGEQEDRVTLMTLHAAKGLEFETVFLPGWEEGLFPHPRALDEQGKAGLEEERRLAYVGLTRAKRRAKVSFAANRRIHGLWQSTIPSRFVDELPEASVAVREAPAHLSAFRGASRFDAADFTSSYGTPGWRRAQERREQGAKEAQPAGGRRGPQLIEGELIAKSSGVSGAHSVGARVFHQKFGPGTVEAAEGNKLTVEFDKAGRKMVIDSFLSAA